MLLGDGICIPSFLSVETMGTPEGSDSSLNDITLRLGEVKRLIYPNDPNSYGRKTVEYEIEVQHRETNGIYNTTTWRGCTISTVFGGIADRFHATLRPDSNPDASDRPIGSGSKVLVLCLNGDRQKAIILGAVEDPQNTRPENKDSGHNLFFEFNGVRFTVDKEGQADLLFRGATKADGTLVDVATPEAEGTHIKLDKDGNVTVATPNDTQVVKVNHKDHKIEIQAENAFEVTSSGKVSIKSQGPLETSSSVANISANGNINMSSSGVHVGAATDSWMKGTTYRTAEAALHAQLVSGVTALTPLFASLAATFTTAITTNPLLAPLGPAIPIFTSIGTVLAPLSAAISAFESQSPTFLSLKNRTD